MDELLDWLQEIYANDLCNGSWEHEHGFFIDNIDNPGWSFKFDLRDTYFDDIPLERVVVEKDENDWYQCWIKDNYFEGVGGAKNLTDILRTFKNWYIHASQIVDSREENSDEK